MRKYLTILLIVLVCGACSNLGSSNPYRDTLQELTIKVVYPEGYENSMRAGMTISVEDINLSNKYKFATNLNGEVKCTLPAGLYRIAASDMIGDDIFNGMKDHFLLNEDKQLSIDLTHSIAGHLIIKEIYCGGCMKTPDMGTYQLDKYIIIHNNYIQTEYLDSLCFGSLAPYNSNSNNPYPSLPEYLPIIQAVWQFPGSGRDFPLEPGEDAVVAIYGAIDHSAQYPLSVNLNKREYFVCYNPVYFTNTSYHPAPGNQIQEDHWLNVVIKTGQANAYTFSVNSPAAVIFRPNDGTSMAEFVQRPDAIEQLPGSSTDKVVKVPVEWVCDAVEVFNGSSATNSKRFLSTLDAGYIELSSTYLGHTLMRKVDEDLSAARGVEVLVDTNNSSNDFYETEKQSLHE